jgi:hypothetical protein
MPTWVTAILLKHQTTDGLCEIQDHIPLGKKYQVDLDRIEQLDLYHTEKKASHTKEVIYTDEDSWLPTEILLIPGYKQQ